MTEALTEQDIIDDPHKFGFCTFDEFAARPEKWLGHLEDALACIERGGEVINRFIRKHRIYVEGYRCDSLEEAQRVMRSMGIREDSIEWKPSCVNMVGGKCDLEIRIFSKDSARRRAAW